MDIIPSTSSVNPITQFKIVEACDYGKQFSAIFFEKLDKGRHSLSKLFHTDATLIWNGNPVFGCQAIEEFYKKLPTSETSLYNVDAQPVMDSPHMPGQKMITVNVSGRIKFKNGRNMPFTEVFTLLAEAGSEKNLWKIVNDTFRSNE